MKIKITCLVLSLAFLTSCEKFFENPSWNNYADNYPDNQYCVLNNGNWGSNDASLGCYERKKYTYYYKKFEEVNNKKLGDIGQDIMQYGDKIYVAVSESKTIFVLDKSFKILQQISPDGCKPRSFAARHGKVYVSLYEGYLGEIDTLDFSFRKVKVGRNPEGVVVFKDKICVANSGGMSYPNYANSVSVVNPTNFAVEDSLIVNLNPKSLFAQGDNLYIHSLGDFDKVLPMLQVYNDGKLSDTGYKNVSMVAQLEDAMYVLTDAYDIEGAHIYMHNALTNTRAGSFLPAGAILENAYSISATRYFLWIGCSDYTTTGDILVFDRLTGRFCLSFDSYGLNPHKVIEIL